MLSCLWDGAYIKLVANEESAAGFFSRSPSAH